MVRAKRLYDEADTTVGTPKSITNSGRHSRTSVAKSEGMRLHIALAALLARAGNYLSSRPWSL